MKHHFREADATDEPSCKGALEGDTIQDMDYGLLGTSLSQGQLDVGAAALCATDERKKSMNFTDVYYDAGIIVAVAEENETIGSVDDLVDGEYVVAVQTGTIAYEYAAENLPGTAYSIKTGEIHLKIVGNEAIAYLDENGTSDEINAKWCE